MTPADLNDAPAGAVFDPDAALPAALTPAKLEETLTALLREGASSGRMACPVPPSLSLRALMRRPAIAELRRWLRARRLYAVVDLDRTGDPCAIVHLFWEKAAYCDWRRIWWPWPTTVARGREISPVRARPAVATAGASRTVPAGSPPAAS